MSYAEQVKNAASPQLALLAVAEGIDTILAALATQAEARVAVDPWGEWTNHDTHVALNRELQERVYSVEGDEEDTVVQIPGASEHKKEQRRQLAVAMDLAEHMDLDGEDPVEVYAKGGPVWLYHNDRDFIMSLPIEMRTVMVADVDEDDHNEAHELSKDILKGVSIGGPDPNAREGGNFG